MVLFTFTQNTDMKEIEPYKKQMQLKYGLPVGILAKSTRKSATLSTLVRRELELACAFSFFGIYFSKGKYPY